MIVFIFSIIHCSVSSTGIELGSEKLDVITLITPATAHAISSKYLYVVFYITNLEHSQIGTQKTGLLLLIHS
jgi:hypothetical protein